MGISRSGGKEDARVTWFSYQQKSLTHFTSLCTDFLLPTSGYICPIGLRKMEN